MAHDSGISSHIVLRDACSASLLQAALIALLLCCGCSGVYRCCRGSLQQAAAYQRCDTAAAACELP